METRCEQERGKRVVDVCIFLRNNFVVDFCLRTRTAVYKMYIFIYGGAVFLRLLLFVSNHLQNCSIPLPPTPIFFVTSAVARFARTAGVRTPATRAAFSTSESGKKEVEVVVPHMEGTLEWVLPSPPPLHCFDEPPLFVLCTDDNDCEWVNPGAH